MRRNDQSSNVFVTSSVAAGVGNYPYGHSSETSEVNKDELSPEVLKHIKDFEEILENFYELLSDDGILIISGPTENQIYKMGRTLANFRGDYHERSIYDIIEKTEEKFKVLRIKTLFKLMPFFEIFTAKKI